MARSDRSVSDDEFRAVMASFASGVTVVTVADDRGAPLGLTATAFCSVSRDPPLCLVCVSHDAEAHPVIRATGHFAVNFLAQEQRALSLKFATHGLDKFGGVPWTTGEATGCPILEGALASIECRVESTTTAGDHDVFLGAIERVSVGSGEPLVYFRGRYI